MWSKDELGETAQVNKTGILGWLPLISNPGTIQLHEANSIWLCVQRVIFFPLNKKWPLQVLLFWCKHDVYTNQGTSVLVLLIPNKVMVTGPFLGTYSAKFIMQQCKKTNSLDQILTSVVNLGHLMDVAGSVPVYTKKQMEVFSFFTPYHHHVYFLLLLVFLCNWCSFLKEILCLPVFFFPLSGAADLVWAVLQGRDVVRYRVSACVPCPFPFPLLLRFVEQMVWIPMVALDAAEVSSLMPRLYHGNSLWSFWRIEHTVDYCSLFMTFEILLGLYFFLLFSSTSLPNLSQRSLVWTPLQLGEYCFFHYCC